MVGFYFVKDIYKESTVLEGEPQWLYMYVHETVKVTTT